MRYLEEVFDSLWIVAVALPTDPLHLFNLARLTSSLDVLKMYVLFLAEVYDRPQEVKQALNGDKAKLV